MLRSFSFRCVSSCCSLPVVLTLLSVAAFGVGRATEALIVDPEPGVDADAPGVVPEDPLPEPSVDTVPEEENPLLTPVVPEGEAGELAEIPLDEASAGFLPEEDLWLPEEPDVFEDLDLGPGELEIGPIGIAGVAPAYGQSFDSGVRGRELLPSGFQSPMETKGFRFGVNTQLTYNSNIFADESGEVDDFTFTISPTVQYRSAPDGVPGQVSLSYTPFIRLYVDQTDLNTIDHSASGTVSYAGARGTFSASVNYGLFTHTDRESGGLQETESFSYRSASTYQIASRTSLEATSSFRITNDNGVSRSGNSVSGTGSDDRVSQFQLAGFWQATTRTRFGPSVRFSRSTSDNVGDRDAQALLFVADYQPRPELSLNGSIGVEQVQEDGFMGSSSRDSTNLTGGFGVNYRPNDRISLQADLTYAAIPQSRSTAYRSGGGDSSFSGGLSLRYTPNLWWSFGLGVNLDAYPSADSTNYSINDQTYTASVTRTLPTGSISLVGSLSFSGYDSVGTVDRDQDDGEYRSVTLSYGRPVFAERASFSSSLQWADNSGNTDWSRFQATLGLGFGF